MRKSIWIADDDPDDRMIIKEAFEENDYFETIQFQVQFRVDKHHLSICRK